MGKRGKKVKKMYDELTQNEKEELATKTEPWQKIFIERFNELLKEKSDSHDGFSKKELCEECNKLNSNLLYEDTKIYGSLISDITNLKVSKIRKPNISILIRLASYFNVTIDYLVGRNECRKPENEDIYSCIGISEQAIEQLRFKALAEKTIAYVEAINRNEDKNAESFYCKRNKKAFSEINSLIEKFPHLFKDVDSKINDADKIDVIQKKLDKIRDMSPSSYFFETLSILITYKNGIIIHLLAQYLFREQQYIVREDVISKNEIENTNNYLNYQGCNILNKDILLTQIQSEIIRMNNNTEKLDI